VNVYCGNPPRCYHHARLNLDEWHDDVIFGDVYAAWLERLEAGALIGDPERIRTSDPQLRRLLLYPTELRDRALPNSRTR
jgi:hypothetical protein